MTTPNPFAQFVTPAAPPAPAPVNPFAQFMPNAGPGMNVRGSTAENPYGGFANQTIHPENRSFGQRFGMNFEDAQVRGTLLGAGINAGVAALDDARRADAIRRGLPPPPDAPAREQNRRDAETYQMRSDADPFYRVNRLHLFNIPGTNIPVDLYGDNAKAAAAVATLGGQLAGGMTSPEAFVGGELVGPAVRFGARAGARFAPWAIRNAPRAATALERVTTPTARTASPLARRLAADAAVNMAVDPAVQGANIAAGGQDQYNPLSTVAAGAVAVAPSALAHGLRARDRRAAARQAARDAEQALAAQRAAAEYQGGGENPFARFVPPEGAPTVRPGPASHDAAQAIQNPGHSARFTGPMADIVHRAAVSGGVDPHLAQTIAQIESHFDPNARSSTGATGLFQFTQGTWDRMGGGDRNDPALNAQRGVALIRENQNALRQRLGREPTSAEIYLAHQQGAGGAGSLLTADPNASALDVLTAVYHDRDAARRAIVVNGGRPDMSAGEFVGLWSDRYARAAGQPGGHIGAPGEAAAPTMRTLTPEERAQIAHTFGTDEIAQREARQAAEREAARSTPKDEPFPGDVPFPGDRPPQSNEIPDPWAPVDQQPEQSAPTLDHTQTPQYQAIDLLRRGRPAPASDRGPNLLDFIARNGGINDVGGDVASLDSRAAGRWGNRSLTNRNGIGLDQMAERAFEAGYFPEHGIPGEHSSDNYNPVTGRDLLDAMDEAMRGNHRYAQPEGAADEIRSHMDDLDQLFHIMEIDPKDYSTEQLHNAVNQFLSTGTHDLHPDGQFSHPHFMPQDDGSDYGGYDAPAYQPEENVNWDGADAFGMRPANDGVLGARANLNPDAARFLASETYLDHATPVLREKVDAGEITTRRESGVGGAVDVVPTRSLADQMEAPGPVFHETSVANGRSLLERIFAGPRNHTPFYVSPNPDLALGQGGKGIRIELDPERVNGSAPQSLANTVQNGVGNGTGEFTVSKTLPSAVRAITTTTQAQMDALARNPRIAQRFDFGNVTRDANGFHVERRGATDAPSRLGAAETPSTETVKLGDGEHQQTLIPGVEPVNRNAQMIADELRRRMLKRGYGNQDPSHAGPLFDENAKAQGDLFSQAPPSGPQDASGQARDLFGNPTSGQPSMPSDAPVARQGNLFGMAAQTTTDPLKARTAVLTAIVKSGGAEVVTPDGSMLSATLNKGGKGGRYQVVRFVNDQPTTRTTFATAEAAARHLAENEHQPTIGRNGLRESPRPSPVAATTIPKAADLNIQRVGALAKRLREDMGLTARQGRMTLKRPAVGEYDTRSGVIRTRSWQEMDVLAHEGGHALEYQNHPSVNAAIRQHVATLAPLAYPGTPPAHLRQDGFAEWFRWYVTNPSYAQKVAPAFYRDFEAALAKDQPRMASDLREIQQAYQDYLNAPSLHSAMANLVTETPRRVESNFVRTKGVSPAEAFAHQFSGVRWDGKHTIPDLVAAAHGAFVGLAHGAYTAAVDDLNPISRATRELQRIYQQNTGRRLDLKASNNPYALARLSRDAYGAGMVDLVHGVVPHGQLDPEGPSLYGALEKALGASMGKWDEDLYKAFNAYLVSRRMIHEYDRFNAGALDRPPDQYSRDYHGQIIDDLNAQHPHWDEAARMVYEWNQNSWRKEFESGLITQETYEAGLRDHPDYVPLMRDMSDNPAGAGGRPVSGSQKFAGGARRFRGSDRQIIDPIQSMMKRSMELSTVIARNEVFKALDDLAIAAGRGGGAIAERIPTQDIKGIDVNISDALASAARNSGMSPRDVTVFVQTVESVLGENARGTIFKSTELNERREPIIYVWRDGEKQAVRLAEGQFGLDMFNALSGMNHTAHNLLTDIFAAPTQALRFGVTVNPAFFLANFIRDQVATAITSDVGFKSFVSGAKGTFRELEQGDVARRYNTVGGIVGGANVASLDKARIERDFQALNRRGINVRRVSTIHGALKLSEVSETGTRLGVFELAFNRAKKEGMSDLDAAREAAMEARDILDFGRRGSRMLTAIRLVTFINPAIQGLDKISRIYAGERVGAAPGGLFAAIRPLFDKGAQAPSALQTRAMKHAVRAWGLMATLGVAGLALRAMYHDDPEYQEFNDNIRSTHWLFRAGGHWIAVPKPFELSIFSSIMERGYEAVAMHDPTAWNRLLSDAGNLLVPPMDVTSDIPAISVPLALYSNRTSEGGQIVPQSLAGRDPSERYTAYTSRLGRVLGRLIHVSPAVVDYVIAGFGGSSGRDLMALSNIGARNPTGFTPESTFVLQRFVRDPNRGSTSQSEFWDLMGQGGGAVQRAGRLQEIANTVRGMASGGRQRDQDLGRYLQTLRPEERTYAVAAMLPANQGANYHPLNRAQKAVGVIGDIRREMATGQIAALNAARVTLTPDQRRDADKALADLSTAEMRNALIQTGVRGWQQRAPLDLGQIRQRLAAANPAVLQALDQRMAYERVIPADQNARAWAQVQPRIDEILNRVGVPRLTQYRRSRSRDGRLLEAQD